MCILSPQTTIEHVIHIFKVPKDVRLQQWVLSMYLFVLVSCVLMSVFYDNDSILVWCVFVCVSISLLCRVSSSTAQSLKQLRTQTRAGLEHVVSQRRVTCLAKLSRHGDQYSLKFVLKHIFTTACTFTEIPSKLCLVSVILTVIVTWPDLLFAWHYWMEIWTGTDLQCITPCVKISLFTWH